MAYVEGLNEKVRDLQRMGVELDDIKDVMASIASAAADVASANAPVQSGKLRAAIRGNRAKGKAVVTAGRASVPYAGAINYGWAKRNIKPAGFMQKADDQIGPKAVQMLDDGIDRLIQQRGLNT